MKFRELFLVVVLVLAGFVLFQFQTGKWNLDDINWIDDIGMPGQEVVVEESRTIEAPVPAAIEIANGHGSVEVRGADQDFVQMTFKKVVWRRKEEEARDIAAQIKYVLTASPDKLVLATNGDELRKKNFETVFILTVPRSAAVTVTNSYGLVRVEAVRETSVRNRNGEVAVADIAAGCVLETSYDDLEAREIKGSCRIVNRNGDVRAASVAGDLSVETRYGHVHVEDIGGTADVRASNASVEALRVAGAIKVDTSYEKVELGDVGSALVTGHDMTVEASGVRGDLEVRASYGPVKVDGVAGKLTVEAHNSSVTARRIEGPSILIRTSYDDVLLADFSAEATVVCRNGHVSLEPRDLKKSLDVRNEYGGIDLLWPAGEKARVEARAKGGSVNWGLADKPDVDETNGTSLIKAYSSEAAAPLIFLSTAYDSIRIEEGARKF